VIPKIEALDIDQDQGTYYCLCLQQHTSQIYSLTNKQTFWLKPKNNQMQNTI
jgi:hypothetical protein